jgi:hypothetical protein
MDEAAFQRLAKIVATGKTSKGLPVSAKKLAEFRAKLDSMHQARGRTGVTPAQMVKELQAVTAEEIKEANKRIGARYVELIKTELKRPRLLAGKTI